MTSHDDVRATGVGGGGGGAKAVWGLQIDSAEHGDHERMSADGFRLRVTSN